MTTTTTAPTRRSTVRATGGSWQLTLVAVSVLAVCAAVLHLRAGFVFPRPWPDEAHFITPALTLLRSGGLAVPELNAAEGIFWVPTGYYVAQLPLLAARIDPLLAGRILSLVGLVGFAGGVFVAAARAGADRTLVFLALFAWVCMPRVVAMGNIARMEGVILGLAGLCLVLVSHDRWPLAVMASVLAPLVHPIGLMLPVAVVAGAIVRGRRRPWSRWEWVALVLVVGLWAGEIIYFLAHADIAAAHLRFQITRKAGRGITPQWWQLLSLAVAALGGAIATWRWRGRGGPLAAIYVALALAGGLVLVDVVGREMWYELLGRETVALLLVLVGLAALARTRVGRRGGAALTVGLAVVLLVGGGLALRATTQSSWYGMSPGPGTRAEWHAFTDAALAELERLDATLPAPAVVVVDPLSGFGQEVVGRPWRRLQFVQPTPATPMNTVSAAYVLATPGVPFVTESLVTQWGAVPPTVEVTSTSGTFALHLYANPAAP